MKQVNQDGVNTCPECGVGLGSLRLFDEHKPGECIPARKLGCHQDRHGVWRKSSQNPLPGLSTRANASVATRSDSTQGAP